MSIPPHFPSAPAATQSQLPIANPTSSFETSFSAVSSLLSPSHSNHPMTIPTHTHHHHHHLHESNSIGATSGGPQPTMEIPIPLDPASLTTYVERFSLSSAAQPGAEESSVLHERWDAVFTLMASLLLEAKHAQTLQPNQLTSLVTAAARKPKGLACQHEDIFWALVMPVLETKAMLLNATQVAGIVHGFVASGRTNPVFWQTMQMAALGAIGSLVIPNQQQQENEPQVPFTPELTVLYVSGFATCNEDQKGTEAYELLWTLLEALAMQHASQLSLRGLVECILGFAQAGRILNSKLWTALQTALCHRLGVPLTPNTVSSSASSRSSSLNDPHEPLHLHLPSSFSSGELHPADLHDIRALMSGLVRVAFWDKALWATLIPFVTSRAPLLSMDQLCDAIHGFSKSGQTDARLWNTLAAVLAQHTPSLGPRHVALSVLAFSNLRRTTDEELWLALESAVIREAANMQPQEIAQCASGLAKSSALRAIHQTQSGPLNSPTASSFGSSKSDEGTPTTSPTLSPSRSLWLALHLAVLRESGRFAAHDVAVCVSSFAFVGYRADPLWKALMHATIREASHFTPEGVVCCVTGYSMCGRSEEQLWRCLQLAAVRQHHGMGPPEIASCVGGFSRAGRTNADLWRALGESTIRVADQLTPQDAVLCISGFSRMERRSEAQVWATLEAYVKRSFLRLAPSEVVVLIAHFAKANRWERSLWNVLEASLILSTDFLSPTELNDCLTILSPVSFISTALLVSLRGRTQELTSNHPGCPQSPAQTTESPSATEHLLQCMLNHETNEAVDANEQYKQSLPENEKSAHQQVTSRIVNRLHDWATSSLDLE